MKKRIISLAAAAVFVIGTLAGCGNSSTQTTDKTASSDASSSGGDLVTVRDAVMTGQLDQYATEIGLWQGIFEKYGIDLQTTEFVAGINTIDAVVNGTADIGMMADYAAVNRLGNTLDATNLQIFSQISGGQSALSGGLYVDPKYADDPKSLDGSAGWVQVATSQEIGIQTGSYFLSTDKYISENTDTLAKFLQAVDESTQYINDHLDESAEYLADKLGLKAEDFKENWKNYSFEPGFSEEATTHLEDIEKWGFEHGSFPKDYNVRDFINTDVAKIAFPDNVTIE